MEGSEAALTPPRPTAVGLAGLATVAALALALVLALDAPAVRMAAALVACLVLPGLGWARRLRLKDLGDTIALTVVLSMSITAVVATAMALMGAWSSVAGLAVLVAVTGLGFVPVRAVVVRAGAVVLGRPDRREDRPPVVEVGDAEDGWTDWYADARARSDEERRRREAEAVAAEQDWRDWYAESRRAAAVQRSAEWVAADRSAVPEVGCDDREDRALDDWPDWTSVESSDETESSTGVKVNP